MFTFYYTYPKQLDNTTGTIPRGAKKQRLRQGQKIKTHNIKLKIQDTLLDSVSSDQGWDGKFGKSRAETRP